MTGSFRVTAIKESSPPLRLTFSIGDVLEAVENIEFVWRHAVRHEGEVFRQVRVQKRFLPAMNR